MELSLGGSPVPRLRLSRCTPPTLHPPGLLANSSLSLPLRVPATHGLLSQGAAPVPRFSLHSLVYMCLKHNKLLF